MQNSSPSLFSDTIESVTRESSAQIFFIRIEARPVEDNPEAAEVAGGYVNVWIDTDVLRSAEIVALEAIENEGWRPHRFDEWTLVDRNGCSEEELDAFDEAVAAGISLSIYTWERDEREEDETPNTGRLSTNSPSPST